MADIPKGDRDALVMGLGILGSLGSQVEAAINLFDVDESDPYGELFAPVVKILKRCHEDVGLALKPIFAQLEVKFDE